MLNEDKIMTKKPTALLIGDSICMGYRPLVKQRLEDKVEIIGVEDNGGDSSNLLKNLDEWMINRKVNLIHFNCGLHDLKVDPKNGDYQQPLDVYKDNLTKIIQRLQNEAKAKLVWATLTPVIDERHNAVKEFYRHERDAEAYNKVATAIMKEAGIVIDDLFSSIMSDDIEICLMPDGVHMTEHGNKLLTETVSKCVLKELNI
jgi:isoamyl acetate esterase